MRLCITNQNTNVESNAIDYSCSIAFDNMAMMGVEKVEITVAVEPSPQIMQFLNSIIQEEQPKNYDVKIYDDVYIFEQRAHLAQMSHDQNNINMVFQSYRHIISHKPKTNFEPKTNWRYCGF